LQWIWGPFFGENHDFGLLHLWIYRLPLHSIGKGKGERRMGKGERERERERRKGKGERGKKWMTPSTVHGGSVCKCAYDLGWIAQFRSVFPGELCHLQLAACVLGLPKWLAPSTVHGLCMCVRAYDLVWIAQFRWVLPRELCYLKLAVCILCLPKWISPSTVHGLCVCVCARMILHLIDLMS